MKSIICFILIFISFSLSAQVVKPKKVTRPNTKVTTKKSAVPNIKTYPKAINLSSSDELKIISSGELYVRNGAWNYTTTTLPDGKVLVAWASSQSRGEATFYTPTLTPYTPIIYTNNKNKSLSAFTKQEATVFKNGNALIVFFEEYRVSKTSVALRLMYVVFDKDRKIIRGPAKVLFTPKTNNSLKDLSVIAGSNTSANVYFTETYMEGSNERSDVYKLTIYDNGSILEHCKRVFYGINNFAPRQLDASHDQSFGGAYIGYKSRDLYVERVDNWKVQATHNVYDLNFIAVHGVAGYDHENLHSIKQAVIFYTEGKTAGAKERLICNTVTEKGPGAKTAITEHGVLAYQVKTLSLKDNSIFVSVAEDLGDNYKATGWIINKNAEIIKGPFQFIDNFNYKPENFSMTQLINGQVFVAYEGLDKKPKYVVVD